MVGLGLHRHLPPSIASLALLVVTHHSGGEAHGERTAEEYAEGPDAALLAFRILKDADGLDRVRLGDLDLARLRLPGSDRRLSRAEELLRLYPEVGGKAEEEAG